MKRKNNAPTMKDVALEAGVSLGTVSKVFNNIPVGEQYAEKVRAASEKLGYRVNHYARGLKAGKTYNVAVIIPGLNHPYFSDLTHYLVTELMRRDHNAVVSVTNSDPEAEQRYIDMLRDNKVDGMIALTYNPELKIDDELPFVSIDRYFGTTIPCISSDNYGGGQLAASRLISLGCRDLLFFRSGSHVVGEPDKRSAGFEAGCRQAGIPCRSLNLPDEQGLTPFFDYIKEHIKEGKPDFDGIFCNTDLLACRVIEKLRETGVRVPEDVQIIGFDGIKDLMTGKPVCSTIVQPVAQIAEVAVEMLLSQNRSQIQALISLPVAYLPGGTTKEPAAEPVMEV